MFKIHEHEGYWNHSKTYCLLAKIALIIHLQVLRYTSWDKVWMYSQALWINHLNKFSMLYIISKSSLTGKNQPCWSNCSSSHSLVIQLPVTPAIETNNFTHLPPQHNFTSQNNILAVPKKILTQTCILLHISPVLLLSISAHTLKIYLLTCAFVLKKAVVKAFQ